MQVCSALQTPRQHPTTQFFTGRMPFLPPNQQRQSTEGHPFILLHTHAHTHTYPFNSFMSGTTRVSRYQKGKTTVDFTGARDSEWQWHQLGHMQVCISLQTDNYASTPPLSFLEAGCPSCHPTNNFKALKAFCSVHSVSRLNMERPSLYPLEKETVAEMQCSVYHPDLLSVDC